jgi:ATP-dependent DNA helicase RecG
MNFDRPYNRDDFAQFISDFLPDDYVPTEQIVDYLSLERSSMTIMPIYLKTRPKLKLEDVIALDKVQKKQEITIEDTKRLRELKLITGWMPHIQIIAENRPQKISYKEYKDVIVKYIKEKGSATREDIEKLIMPTLASDDPIEKRRKKISNILSELSTKELIIKNISKSPKYAVWILRKDDT